MKRIFYPLCAIALLASSLLVSCIRTVDYGGCPSFAADISYTEIDNQSDEAVEVKLYHLTKDKDFNLFSIASRAKQTVKGDIRNCDSLVVASKNASSVFYGSSQIYEPQIGEKCVWHPEGGQRWLSFTITPSVFSK